jgi:putative copper export protein
LKSIPGFAKIIMLLQTAVIVFLLIWVVEEYSNNFYFQAYVNSFLQGTAFTAIVLISIVAFTVIAIALYWKLRRTRKELEGLLSTGRVGSSGNGHGQVLDSQTEQHLIEMIRKTQPIMNSGASPGGMPVLRRSQSPEEERSSQ